MAHLTLKKLLAFRYERLSAAEKKEAQAHLDACRSCRENLALLVKPKSALKITPASTGMRVREPGACFSPEEIGQYVNHELLTAEIPLLEKHLAWCENCRLQLIGIAQCCNEPVAQKTLPGFEIAKHVKAIQKIIKEESDPELAPIPIRPKPKWWPGVLFPRPAFAISIIILLAYLAVKWWAWPEYRYDHFAGQSAAQLLAQYRIYYLGELRPAGDYRSSDTKQKMKPAETTQMIDTLLIQALAYKPNDETARMSLAQYYLLEKHYAAADSVLKILEAASPQNAGVRNDRGYWFYQQRQYEAAAAAFAEAFALNPRLDQALYNLAITQTQLGDTAAARASWEKYLTLDGVKPEWHNAARAQLQELIF